MKNIFSSALSKILPGRYTPKSTPQTAEITQNTQTHEHPSKGLTPQKLHGILEAAERGDMKAQSELFADIEEKDGHIFSEMSKRKRAVIGLDWRVMPPPDRHRRRTAAGRRSLGDGLSVCPISKT